MKTAISKQTETLLSCLLLLHHLFFYLSGPGSCCVLCSIPFRPNSFACKCSLYNESFVRFEAPGFCYIINTGPSLKRLLRHPAVVLSHGDLAAVLL